MTVALRPSFVTATALTVAVGVAAVRPHRAQSDITVTGIVADRNLKATAVGITVPISIPECSPFPNFFPRMAPAAPTATVKSP